MQPASKTNIATWKRARPENFLLWPVLFLPAGLLHAAALPNQFAIACFICPALLG